MICLNHTARTPRSSRSPRRLRSARSPRVAALLGGALALGSALLAARGAHAQTFGVIIDDGSGIDDAVIFNADTLAEVGRVDLGPGAARDAVVLADQTRAFVTRGADVVVIDLANASIITTIPTGTVLTDAALTADQQYVLVASTNAGQNIVSIDTSTLTIAGTGANGIQALQGCADGTVLGVNSSAGTVHRIVVSASGVPSIVAEVPVAAGGAVNVTCGPGSGVGVVVSSGALRSVTYPPLAAGAGGAFTLAGTGSGRYLVASPTDDVVFVLSTSPTTIEAVAVSPTDGAIGPSLGSIVGDSLQSTPLFFDAIAVHPDGSRIYVAGQDRVNVYRTSDLGLDGSIVLGGSASVPMGIALPAGVGAVNTPPEARCVVAQLTNIGNQAQVSFSGAGSTDLEDDAATPPIALAYTWTIDDGVNPPWVASSDVAFDQLLDYGDYVVTLTVTDSDEASDSDVCAVHIDPADLTVFDCEKIEVKFCLGDAGSDPDDDDSSADDHSGGCLGDTVKIRGEIGLPVGVDHAELDAVALVSVLAGDPDFLDLGTAAITFERNGSHWKFRDDAGTQGITRFDIDWKGARFEYRDGAVPVTFRSELITSSETVLTMEYKVSDAGGPFTVTIDGTRLDVDATGVVTSGDLPPEAIDVKKTGKKVTVALPFPLLDGSSIEFGGALMGAAPVLVADHYSNSLGRFKLEAESSSPAVLGADTTLRTVSTWIGVGAPLYPGACDADASELKVHSQKWKAKR